MPASLVEHMVEDVKIPIIFERDSRLPLLSLQLVFSNSGALVDTKAGTAKLSSKLLEEGTRLDGSVKFSTALESRAVSLNASVGGETFVVSLSSLKSEWSFAMSKLLELLKDPNYTEEAFSKVKAQRIGVLSQKQSDFDYIASNGLKSLLFEDTPREHPFGGTIESVQSIVLDDLREHISSHLGTENLVVVAGGDLSEAEVIEMTTDIATALKSVSVAEIKYTPVVNKTRDVSIDAKTEQAYIYFGSPYHISYDSSELYLGKVASFVLGSSGFGSRFMEEIRVKRGLAYSTYANFTTNRTATYFSGHLQTKLESADEAKKVVRDMVDEFVSCGITNDELESAKQFLLGSEPLRTETLQQRIGRAFNEYYNGKELGYSQKELDMIKSIELKEINTFINNHTEIAKLSFFTVTSNA